MIHPIKHFRTITKHRHKVIANCFRAGIGFQGLFHDLSKYFPTEFIQGAKYYQGIKSPNEMERSEYGYSSAWLHHKGRNKHHFEYWTDYSPVHKKVMPVPMPKKYVAEMICDRIAASMIYQGKNYTNDFPYQYFLRGKPNRFIHEKTSDETEHFLVMLKEKGRKQTLKELKKWVRN